MATSPLDYILQGARKILDKGQEAFRDDSNLGIAKNTFAPSSLLSAMNKLYFEQSTAPQQYLKKVTGLKSPAETQRELLATIRANQLPTQRLDQFGLPASTIGKQTTKVTDILKTATPKEKELLALSQARNLAAGFAGYAPQEKALTSIAPQIAKSTDIGKIANLLKKEIPSLADDAANNFARVFKDLTDPKAIDTAINKIKFQAQGKTTGMADDLITNVKAIMETGKPLPVAPSTPVLPPKMPQVASKVGSKGITPEIVKIPENPLIQEAPRVIDGVKYNSFEEFANSFLQHATDVPEKIRGGSIEKGMLASNVSEDIASKNPSYFYKTKDGKIFVGKNTGEVKSIFLVKKGDVSGAKEIGGITRGEGQLGLKPVAEFPVGTDIKSQLEAIWNNAQGTKATPHDLDAVQALREAKGLGPQDIMAKYPDLNLKRDIPVTDVYGNKAVIPEGEALTPYELKGNKVLLQDGETYIVSKNQFQNIKGNALSGEAKPFAPELEGLEETVKGGEIKQTPRMKAKQTLDNYGIHFEEDMPGTEGHITRNGEDVEYDDLPENIRKALDKYVGTAETVRDIKPLPTKYSSYTLPNGENYREVLIKAPESKVNEGDLISFKDWKKNNTYGTQEEYNKVIERAKKSMDKMVAKDRTFISSHWEEPNVISHLRLNDRTYNGKKVTFMEELQSDWAREGRDKGFSKNLPKGTENDIEIKFVKSNVPEGHDPKNYPGYYEAFDKRTSDFLGRGGTKPDLMERALEEINLTKGVPYNPLLKNWQELSIKRALKDAVDNNAEYFAWINGEQTSARYNLATHVDNVQWNKSLDFEPKEWHKNIAIKAKQGRDVGLSIGKDGTILKSITEPTWEGKKLDEVLGKGLADKIMAKERGTLSGEGLKFGGEWANNLYDKQVKNIVEDLTGGKVEMIDLGLPVEAKGENLRFSTGFASDRAFKISDIKIGNEVRKSGDKYIITDILGDGKFKAVPKDTLERLVEDSGYAFDTVGSMDEAIEIAEINQRPHITETFDISSKTTTQQAIRLTPEIKARIRGEAPALKKPSGIDILKTIANNYRKNPKLGLSSDDVTKGLKPDSFDKAKKIRQMKTSAEIPSLERTAEMQGVTPKTSETKLPKQTQGGVEKAQQGYTNRQNPTPTTPLKSSSYKDNTTAMVERKRAFDIPTTPLGIYGKLQQSLSPVKFLDEVSQKIYKNWSRAVEKAKVLGDKELSTFKIPTKDSWQSIIDYQAGKKTVLTSEIKNKFDSLFKEAGARGLDIGYNERYLPQVYKESADEIKDKITQYLLKNGMSKEEILAYQNGKKISDDIARRLKLNPFFSKEKVFPDYKTAMEYGLTPKYTDLNQLVAHYRKEMETTLANRNFIESLINTDKLLLVDDAPSNWKPVELPFSIKGYYAEPRLAKVLNGLFGSDKGFLDTIFSVGASASRRAQEISLSAGVPYTSVNLFLIGQLIKEMTSGNFKSVVPFIRSNFGDKSLQYFTQNRNYLEMMADEGIRLGNHIGTLGNTYKNLTKPNTLWESLGLKFDKAFNEKTFASFMPQLYTQTFKDIYLQGIKSGLAEQEAKKLAGDTVKKAFGLIEDFGRSKKTEDKLSAVFFAPKFREGVVNTLKNTAKAGVEFVSKLGGARAKLDPSFSKNRKLLAGMIVTYGVYNLINYALNSNFMWDNPENRKFALQIPTKGGGLIYIEFMPSFLSFGRNMISGGLNLATGDIKGATQKFGSLFSMPVKTTTEIIANKDYFGNEIYKNEDSVSVKALKIAKYVGLAVNHPYIKEIVNQIGDKKPLSQSAVVALELPIKFGSVQKVAQSKGFSGTLTLEDIQKSIKADVEAGKIDADAAVASYIGQKLRLAESHKKDRLDLPLGDYKKALVQDIKDGLITEEEGVDEYIQYKTEEEQQAKRDEQMRETYPDRNLVKLFVDYAKAYKTDPVNAWKAMFTKEKLDQVKGNKVTFQRFFGKHYLDSKEGSEAYMKKELNKLGISWNDRANYNLEHIIPLTAGGDNSSNNLQIISRELHDSYTPVDIKAGKAVESGKLSRRQVANIIRQLKIDKTITVNEALNML